MGHLTLAQRQALETIERTASCLSLIGTIFIFVTFVSSPKFRRPINRLVFYASWGNTLCNIATLMSVSPPRRGPQSPLCFFQAFLIQMFVPADALWNLAMAFNVYLTLFRKYNAQQLKALEWRYHLMCYGAPFIVALALVFAETQERGKVYGDAVLWCWISSKWDFLRVALCYGPAWICILASFGIYLMAGREIFKKRFQLRAFKDAEAGMESTLSNFKTTNVEITSTDLEASALTETRTQEAWLSDPDKDDETDSGKSVKPSPMAFSGKPFARYTVNIASSPVDAHRSSHPSVVSAQSAAAALQHRRNRAAAEANRAAWGYTKVALLFFISLLVTWVPSSVNRVYSLVHPGELNVPLAYVAGTVLSLMGFWNGVIYIVTTRAACAELFFTVAMYRIPWRSKAANADTSRRPKRPHRVKEIVPSVHDNDSSRSSSSRPETASETRKYQPLTTVLDAKVSPTPSLKANTNDDDASTRSPRVDPRSKAGQLTGEGNHRTGMGNYARVSWGDDWQPLHPNGTWKKSGLDKNGRAASR